MSEYLRLRQICLVAPELEKAVADVDAIFGIEPCHRDPAVGKYGLVNALWAFGPTFLEIVAPMRAGTDTAAGRFLARSGGRGGYMAIFDCSDPQRRRKHAEHMKIRVANVMDKPPFWGLQLHPQDCRAAMIEFDHTDGGEQSLDGAYWPAGEHWQDFVDTRAAREISAIEVASSDVTGIAQHWARICEVPLADADSGEPRLAFDVGSVRFVAAAPGERERLGALHVKVGDPREVNVRAVGRGCERTARGFVLCGVEFVPQA